jgi:hypothetical protein
MGGRSYQSAQDPRLHFGLGERSTIDSLEVLWPSGITTKVGNLKANQILALEEGKGLVQRSFPRVDKT